MRVTCPGTPFSTTLPDSTATTEQPNLGECAKAYCGQCGEHHWMQVRA